jgi:hypothetical protein
MEKSATAPPVMICIGDANIINSPSRGRFQTCAESFKCHVRLHKSHRRLRPREWVGSRGNIVQYGAVSRFDDRKQARVNLASTGVDDQHNVAHIGLRLNQGQSPPAMHCCAAPLRVCEYRADAGHTPERNTQFDSAFDRRFGFVPGCPDHTLALDHAVEGNLPITYIADAAVAVELDAVGDGQRVPRCHQCGRPLGADTISSPVAATLAEALGNDLA